MAKTYSKYWNLNFLNKVEKIDVFIDINLG